MDADIEYIAFMMIIFILLSSYWIPLVNYELLIRNNIIIVDNISENTNITYIYSQSRLARPSIIIHEKNGKHYPVIIHIYASLPNTTLYYLGSTTGMGKAYFTYTIMSNLEKCSKEWIRHRGSIKYFKLGLLFFIDLLDKINTDNYRVYSLLASAPLNLELLQKGYVPEIRIRIDLSKYKPTKRINLNRIKEISGREGLDSNNRNDNRCIIVKYGLHSNFYYCSKWVLDNVLYMFKHKPLPFLAAYNIYEQRSLPYTEGYVKDLNLLHLINVSSNSWFAIIISAKITGLNKPKLLVYNMYSHFYEEAIGAFYNKNLNKYLGKNDLVFTKDFVASLGIYGSGFMSVFRRYDTISTTKYISDRLLSPTSVTANLTVFDIDLEYREDTWIGNIIPLLDNVTDGKGWLERYIIYIKENTIVKEVANSDYQLFYLYREYLREGAKNKYRIN